MPTTTKKKSAKLSPEETRRRESGLPGGGKGRVDEVIHHGIFPYSGEHPPDADPELMTPETLIHAPYEESGRSDRMPSGPRRK